MNNPPENSNSSADGLITIASGEEMEVTHLNGSKETVKVRRIALSKLQSFMLALGTSDTAEEIALYCDKPKEWSDSLSDDSIFAIAAKGQELNSPGANAWMRHQAKWREVMVASLNEAKPEKETQPSTSAASSGSQQ
jgi:hypothetical protein